MANVLELLEDANWDTMIPNLLDFAEKCVASYSWNTAEGLPEGKTTEDIVYEMISKTIASAKDPDRKKGKKGQRFWDPETVPDLGYFLKQAIKSEIWKLLNSLEHKSVNYNDLVPSGELESIIDKQVEDSSVIPPKPGPEEVAIELETNNELFDRCWEKLEAEINDVPMAEDVLTAYRVFAEDHEFVSNKMISEELGITIEDVRNVLKKIRRRARKIYEGEFGEQEED